MSRYLLCKDCIDEMYLHPEDQKNGYHQRRVYIPKAKLPDGLKVIITTKDKDSTTREEIPVTKLKCDTCDGFIEQGTPCVAVTHWRGSAEPKAWEGEYGQA